MSRSYPFKSTSSTSILFSSTNGIKFTISGSKFLGTKRDNPHGHTIPEDVQEISAYNRYCIIDEDGMITIEN